MIKEAKVFMNGQSQAVRLPKDCRFATKSVFINKIGSSVVLSPKNDPWQGLIEACDEFSSDFMSQREDLPVQERDWLT